MVQRPGERLGRRGHEHLERGRCPRETLVDEDFGARGVIYGHQATWSMKWVSHNSAVMRRS